MCGDICVDVVVHMGVDLCGHTFGYIHVDLGIHMGGDMCGDTDVYVGILVVLSVSS